MYIYTSIHIFIYLLHYYYQGYIEADEDPENAEAAEVYRSYNNKTNHDDDDDGDGDGDDKKKKRKVGNDKTSANSKNVRVSILITF
jgi:hypothetical protein